jgi:hypothetical protein
MGTDSDVPDFIDRIFHGILKLCAFVIKSC